jgi:hypothetical protein
MPRINLGFVVLVLIFAVLVITRYLLLSKRERKLWRRYHETLQEREAFLRSFNARPFEDFSAFDFRLGRFSHVLPFPRFVEGEWRYRIYLDCSEAEDVVTITHEISECAVGRVIERLLRLEKPLYLLRKENGKFWVHGRRQRYLIEHVMVTLGEIGDLTPKKLRDRLNKEDAEIWLNPSEVDG